MMCLPTLKGVFHLDFLPVAHRFRNTWNGGGGGEDCILPQDLINNGFELIVHCLDIPTFEH